YKGNYSYYIEKKAEREMAQSSEIDKAKNLYRRELEWVRRMPKARGTKSKSRLDAFDEVKDKALTRTNTDKLQLSVKMTRLGGKILELINLKKSYGDKTILKPFSYVFKKGEKVGVIGKNGVGKSTFLNMVLGLEQPDTGKITTGETIVFGYYSQAGMVLKEDKRVIELMRDFGDYIPMADGSMLTASQLLTRFMFPPEAQYGFVSKLSGGERRRLYLMTLLITNPNFLVLDEPTNDLDIVTLGILEDFLADFPGCVLIVTHDRYFMDRLVDHLFVFEGDGAVRDFPGNYSDYRESEFYGVSSSEKEKPQQIAEEIKSTPVTSSDTSKKKLSYKEKSEYESLEKEIAELELKKTETANKMNSGAVGHTELAKLAEEFKLLSAQLDEKSLRWLELSELV
ncbi:MAG: ATP-binding cassette domain-containing protein, partial [Bacteroidia bacterium]|nr:ATP-binding cassette domain-containing protein [Bacteroidia bacterium]